MTTSELPSNRRRVFVGGPIQYGLREDLGFDPALKDLVCRLLRELEALGYEVLSAHEVEQFGGIDVSGQTEEVARRDYEWMLSCDAYVGLLPAGTDGQPYRSDGTCIELGWASALKKPILILFSSRATYSHLFSGLGRVANVSYLSIEQISQDPSLIKNTLYLLLCDSPRLSFDKIDGCATLFANPRSQRSPENQPQLERVEPKPQILLLKDKAVRR